MTFFGLKFWKVTGHSMFPRIPQNSYVLVGEWRIFKKIRNNQAVLINHPKYGLIIKTVAIIDKNNLIWCKGENATSMSVEKLGPVSKKQIIGRVIKVFSKPQSSSN
ncbi:nickel-type superoxide dismutase maturation protease [Colwellia sp. 20A7]|jgi:nickel-type superoxide dismutase maturation protease|uniref:nickel-type superoxide dismutase maturation protease n=1 Tax=Colwellia sp. 20A7 TaxID=2689569 RepID=UPI0022A784E9|nr:nickel-type superoxide dismutase maturation protease [Colwellia sp. 20A7]